jgi:predicted nucleic acid-binding protein
MGNTEDKTSLNDQEAARKEAPQAYLETTIFNFPFADDSPEYQRDTRRLFEEIKAGKFQPFTSEYALRELEDTKDIEKLEKMKSLVSNHGVTVLPANNETKRLADTYVANKIIPEKYATDALHIAAATIAGMDFIVSLNFKHIVQHKTIIETENINAREGYKRIFIHTPRR